MGSLASSSWFMPHGHCYLWQPAMVWLQVLTNLFIGLAYMAISGALWYLVKRIQDVPFRWMYVAFGVFIVACGITHLFEIVTIWRPLYWIDGGIRLVTAIASVGTAILLMPIVPKAILLGQTARIAHQHGMRLESLNRELLVLYQQSRETLAEAIPQLVWTATADGQVDYMNSRWTQRVGLTLEQSLGEGWFAAMHPDDLPELRRRWSAAVADGTPFECEQRIRQADGSYRWHLSRALPLRDGEHIVKWFGTATDIDDARRAAEEREQLIGRLEASERAFRATFEQAAVGIAHVAPDGHFLRLNRRYCEILGYDEEELRARSFQQVTHPDDLPADVAASQSLLAGERTSYQMDKRYIRKDAAITWVRLYASLVRDAAERPEYFVAVVESIDARRAAAQQREEALEHAREALKAREVFLAIAAHELRTPLTPMRLQVEGLLRTARQRGIERISAERLERRLSAAARQVDRMEQLVNRLLDVSRLQSGAPLELHREPLDLSALVQEVVERHRAEGERYCQQISLEQSGSLVGDWDRLRVEQIVTNLLTNAFKFCEGQPVRVAVFARDAAACVEVSDRGPGIAPEDQQRIFERFERAVSARHYGGLGLGLWIASELTRAHGGAIRLESSPGEGATFRLELPMG